MASSPLILGEAQHIELARLRHLASRQPVHMPNVVEQIKTPEGKATYLRRMAGLTISLPTAFMVTLSIETGHPIGTCRHMSMSSVRKGRLPTLEAVWMVAEALGFVGGLRSCEVWKEDLERNDGPTGAINIAQPVAMTGSRQA